MNSRRYHWPLAVALLALVPVLGIARADDGAEPADLEEAISATLAESRPASLLEETIHGPQPLAGRVPGDVATERSVVVGPPLETTPSTRLTNDSLQEMLELMGYEPTVQDFENGARRFVIEARGWYVNLEISGNEEWLWAYAFLGQIAEPSASPTDKLLGLLASNSVSGYFTYNESFQWLTLQQPNRNRDITAGSLRRSLDDITDHLARSSSLWNVSNW